MERVGSKEEQQLGQALGESLAAVTARCDADREGVRGAAAANEGGNGCSIGCLSRNGNTPDTTGEAGRSLPEAGNGHAEAVAGATAVGAAAATADAGAAIAADTGLSIAPIPGAEEELLLLDLPVTGCMESWEVAPTSAELKVGCELGL